MTIKKRLTNTMTLIFGIALLIGLGYFLFFSPQLGVLPKMKYSQVFATHHQKPYIDTLRIFELVNDYRASHGLTMLLFNQNMCPFAKKRLQQIHTDFSHSGYTNSVIKTYCKTCTNAGENLAEGQPDEESIFQDWIHSPEHLANIVKPQYTETCIALDKYKDTWYTVQEFASNFSQP